MAATPSSKATPSTTCGVGVVRDEWAGGKGVALSGIFLLHTPAPKDRLLLNPDPLDLVGEEGAEFGPQELDRT